MPEDFPQAWKHSKASKPPSNTGKAKRHYFGEILFIALSAMVCGLEGFDDFERFGKRHWGIENRCHRVLNVTFNEDQCRGSERPRRAEPRAPAQAHHQPPAFLRADKTVKDTMLGKRIRAVLCEDTLKTLMKINVRK